MHDNKSGKLQRSSWPQDQPRGPGPLWRNIVQECDREIMEQIWLNDASSDHRASGIMVMMVAAVMLWMLMPYVSFVDRIASVKVSWRSTD